MTVFLTKEPIAIEFYDQFYLFSGRFVGRSGSVSLLNGISTFLSNLIWKLSLKKNSDAAIQLMTRSGVGLFNITCLFVYI